MVSVALTQRSLLPLTVWRLVAGLTCLAVCAVNAAAQPSADASASVTGPVSGYMDFHFNKPDNSDGQLDFHRFVLIFSHTFSPRIRFVAELELEHAVVEGLEEKGAVELEQAYVDFLLTIIAGFGVTTADLAGQPILDSPHTVPLEGIRA